jgi:hypothetical protein
MKVQTAISKALIIAVVLTFGGASELAQAWQQPGQENESAPAINGTTVNPSQGPLTPLPSAPEPQQTAPAPQPQPAPSTQMEQKQPVAEQEPLGTAAAEQVPANGGAASRPAGTAIAPAKQHQMRSLVLKLGAVAAAGIAIGTVAALSKGTSSTPSH